MESLASPPNAFGAALQLRFAQNNTIWGSENRRAGGCTALIELDAKD
jgi:hypothetical protein